MPLTFNIPIKNNVITNISKKHKIPFNSYDPHNC